jgi:DNA repair photolyase
MIPEIPAKTIVSGWSYASEWFGASYNMNIYKGCCHGCIYCDSRCECYRIEDFDTVRAKRDALGVIERDLKAKRRSGILHTGAMSDPYNPFERELQLTRGAFMLADRYGFGVHPDTKSPLGARDIDVLRSIRRHSPAAVNVTVTTADDALCRRIERSVAPSSARLDAISRLADSGIPCGVLLMPILPFINDTEENVLAVTRLAKSAGARWIFTFRGFGVTLRQNQRDYFYEKLDAHFPGIRRKYVQSFGGAYECRSPRSERLWDVFAAECEKLGLLYKMPDIINEVNRGYEDGQISLF